jgi:hypothetical protein
MCYARKASHKTTCYVTMEAKADAAIFYSILMHCCVSLSQTIKASAWMKKHNIASSFYLCQANHTNLWMREASCWNTQVVKDIVPPRNLLNDCNIKFIGIKNQINSAIKASYAII